MVAKQTRARQRDVRHFAFHSAFTISSRRGFDCAVEHDRIRRGAVRTRRYGASGSRCGRSTAGTSSSRSSAWRDTTRWSRRSSTSFGSRSVAARYRSRCASIARSPPMAAGSTRRLLASYRRQLKELFSDWMVVDPLPWDSLLLLPGVVVEQPTLAADSQQDWPLIESTLEAALREPRPHAHARKAGRWLRTWPRIAGDRRPADAHRARRLARGRLLSRTHHRAIAKDARPNIRSHSTRRI